ncbi:MAG: hypothetical protein LAO51_15710 [Acidobacteriia bacterium]|nr:hypothetical protein [Terriglobia bacterium]
MTAGPKDFWDKVAIVVQPLGGLLIGVAVAGVGFMGSDALNRRQALDTNARLYSELMSRREEAESSLRKDMFVSIIQNFLQPKEGDVDAKVLNLELLAYNFHESLNLKPLFLDLSRRLQKLPDRERKEFQDRVNRVAREITEKELFALEGHGKTFRRSVDLDVVNSTPGGLALDGERVVIGDKVCDVNLRALRSGVDPAQITVRLEVKAPENAPDQADTRAQFDVGWYDFPMIDNTRLANGLRCAVTLSAFSPSNADLATVCFPAEYASLKDRPYYDEVIQKLQESARSEEASKR